jgi:20S proteasome subunit alpha 5
MIFILVIQLGTTAIGIQTSKGVVLAAEKRVTSPLMEPRSVEKVILTRSLTFSLCCLTFSLSFQTPQMKIVELDTHIGCAMSGLIADGRTLVDHARVEAQVSNTHILEKTGGREHKLNPLFSFLQ